MSDDTSWEIKTVGAEEAQFTIDTVQRLINNSELAKIARESNILTAAGFHHATWMLATDIIEVAKKLNLKP